MKTERIEIRISPEQKQAFEKKAKQTGMKPSEAIRYLMQRWLESSRS